MPNWAENELTIKRAYKTELDLNNQQKTACEKHIEAARFAYNWGLEQKIKAYQSEKKTPSYYDLHKVLNALKKTDFEWLYEVSKCAPQEALRDLDSAFAHFFRRVKEKKAGKKIKAGYPKFKKRSQAGSFRLLGTIIVYQRAIQLPRLGILRLKEKGYFPLRDVKINHATVSRRANRWFVSINIEIKQTIPPPICGTVVGVDLGINRLATFSDGTIVENPRALRKNLKKIKRISKAVSRRKKGSANWDRAVKRLSALHLHVSNVRNNILHHATSHLAKTRPAIVIEDLNVRAMMQNRSLAQSIADVGWFRFRNQLVYKCNWYGSQVFLANRFFPSTKLCSNCGALKSEIRLDERIYQCDQCGIVIDRDLNAAKNLEQLITASSAGV